MDWRMYALSMFAFIVIGIPYTIQDSGKIEATDGINSLYAALYDNRNVNDKRSMLFRYGKRTSLLRFGKRSGLLRFGKRSGLFRFGKRHTDFDQEDEFETPLDSADLLTTNSDPGDIWDSINNKRNSLLRFGKKLRDSSSMYDRSIDKYKKPHTPWRFGREELEELFGNKLPFNSIKLNS